MTISLVIVESPAKCKKIEEYLGPGYKCIASFGHLRQLKSLKAIDMKNNFETKYENIDEPKKAKHIEFLRKEIAVADEIILATDHDREGEAIAWHICDLFELPISTTKRIIFHEITESAIQTAVSHPTTVNMDMVHSQQARQILDLIVGFNISPMLWKYISKKSDNSLSAGRCQTPALKLIYDNQQEINNSPGQKVYNTVGYFTSKCIPFELTKTYETEEKMTEFLEQSVIFKHIFTRTEPVKVFKQQPEPLTTSRIQQIASNELHISPKETMKYCQTLYEGGYITYMRTDSKKYSEEFINSVKEFILKNYTHERYIYKNIDELSLSNLSIANVKPNNKKYLPPQEAHESIRPTNLSLKTLPENMQPREKKLYKLIWENTLESCMSPAEFYTIHSTITAYDNAKYSHVSELADFLGWKIVKNKQPMENKEYHYLSQLKQNNVSDFKKVSSKITVKNTKQHFTEAKLIQLLEENGIGRPSTFAMLVEKIQERKYVIKEDVIGKQIQCKDFDLEDNTITETVTMRIYGNEKGKLVIQQVGIIVMEFLEKNFIDLFNYDYTKNMEDGLDKICKGEQVWFKLCESCSNEINVLCEKLKGEKKHEIMIDDTHSYIIGKHGPVIKCIVENISGKSEISFKPVKSDIDLHKLEKGEYKLEEVIENPKKLFRVMGKYCDEDLIIKKGKYGLYATWGEKSKSLSSLGNRPIENIEYTEVTKILDLVESTSSKSGFASNIIRKLTNNISIRTGKFGDYIFYKTEKMTNPQFLKLGNFKEDYKNCDKNIILGWIANEYKVK